MIKTKRAEWDNVVETHVRTCQLHPLHSRTASSGRREGCDICGEEEKLSTLPQTEVGAHRGMKTPVCAAHWEKRLFVE